MSKEHNWIALIRVNLNNQEVGEALQTGIVPKDVTQKDIAFTGVGCWDCEEYATLENYLSACKGEKEED